MPQTRIPLPMLRTIVFATDLTEGSDEVFRSACSLARGEATRLIVLHVEEPIRVSEAVGFGEMGMPLYIAGLEAPRHEELLRRVQERFVPSKPVEIEYQVRRGVAQDEIIQTAAQAHADLIVMGTSGRTGMDRLLLGSVAEAVMRRSPCACLTFRAAPSARAEALPAATPIRTIVHPTDFSHHSEGALAVARTLARDLGARLVLLHVVPFERLAGVVPEAVLDVDLGREALDHFRQRAEGPGLKQPVESQLRRGHPVAEILDAAASLDADLIVMGSHGRHGLPRLLLGSVAEGVMRGAHCPVMTVRNRLPAQVLEAVASTS